MLRAASKPAQPSGTEAGEVPIYASDEKGFSVSDEPFKVVVGESKEVPSTHLANFVTEVSATETAVIGAEVNLPNANRAFYRVVAVAEQGKRSGPSDFAQAPRPVLYSRTDIGRLLATRGYQSITARLQQPADKTIAAPKRDPRVPMQEMDQHKARQDAAHADDNHAGSQGKRSIFDLLEFFLDFASQQVKLLLN